MLPNKNLLSCMFTLVTWKQQ